MPSSWHGVRTGASGDAFDNVYDSLPDHDHDEVPSAEFRVGDRWVSTTTFGSTGVRGNPVTITWGFVDDGTTVVGSEGSSPSNLIAMLNTQYGGGRRGIESAPWFHLFEEAFGRWSELSGITYVYEPNDGGATLNNTTTPRGQLGVYPDVRIGGHSIDGASGSNTLAYNYFPDHGDMVIDTDNSAFYGNSQFNSRRLRNVLMHEAGHGLGFNHLESSDSGQLMEPFISTSFDGPQIDDILAAHRNYGDVLEKNGGNDSLRSPTPVGLLPAGDIWRIGVDGATSVVSSSQTDFVSIDGRTDLDFYSFRVAQPVEMALTLTQVGRTYMEGPQDGAQNLLDTSRLNPLEITLFGDDAAGGLIQLAAGLPRGDVLEFITDVVLFPGQDYFFRVNGTVDNVQLYQLSLSLTATAVPEPASLAAALLLSAGGIARRAA
ncbi:matrixin family metalloprotease [Botrimarina colliarenosi]|uniref:matrixin family metalloprotease n=1 Tax=Botrimarina colliarenosi TaxID=2528001 RepID=UPI0018D39F53|nr:matrixin family metalloprotease [Botrimarina colliarenosi]